MIKTPHGYEKGLVTTYGSKMPISYKKMYGIGRTEYFWVNSHAVAQILIENNPQIAARFAASRGLEIDERGYPTDYDGSWLDRVAVEIIETEKKLGSDFYWKRIYR